LASAAWLPLAFHAAWLPLAVCSAASCDWCQAPPRPAATAGYRGLQPGTRRQPPAACVPTRCSPPPSCSPAGCPGSERSLKGLHCAALHRALTACRGVVSSHNGLAQDVEGYSGRMSARPTPLTRLPPSVPLRETRSTNHRGSPLCTARAQRAAASGERAPSGRTAGALVRMQMLLRMSGVIPGMPNLTYRGHALPPWLAPGVFCLLAHGARKCVLSKPRFGPCYLIFLAARTPNRACIYVHVRRS
jgi:hypothetical protein